jgi:hypothetical protein
MDDYFFPVESDIIDGEIGVLPLRRNLTMNPLFIILHLINVSYYFQKEFLFLNAFLNGILVILYW